MATYATASGAAAPVPALGLYPGAVYGQQDHEQQHHLQQQHQHHLQQQHQHQHQQQQQQQASQINLEQQLHQARTQVHVQAQQQNLDQPAPVPAPQQPADVSAPGPAGSVKSNSGSAGLSLGLGILNKLGLDRKTNRDGQPAKRRGPKPDSKPALTRRQELNRQAQRTHRQRKEVYIKSLEDQVMTYKEHLAVEIRNRGMIEEENRKLRELLVAHGINIPPGFHLSSPQHYAGYGSATSDGGLGSSNGDYASPSSYNASASDLEGHQHGPGSAHSARMNARQPQANLPLNEQMMQGNPAQDQLGIDFVLDLEAFCNDHSQYLCVRSSQSSDSELPVASGHALMLSCPPLSHIENNPSDPYPHQAPNLPHASLVTLLESAKQLPLNGDGEITPILALALIQTDPRYGSLRVKEFLSIQGELKEKTRCYGFGAVLEEFEVRDAIESAFTGRAKTN